MPSLEHGQYQFGESFNQELQGNGFAEPIFYSNEKMIRSHPRSPSLTVNFPASAAALSLAPASFS